MKTILEAIQQYPDQFIDTINARANTTPSEANKINHRFLSHWIKMEEWEYVTTLLKDPTYSSLTVSSPLEGVICCLSRYSDMERETFWEIFELLEEGKIV
ncbi:hypothetical protein NVP1187O_222 [Vibrio phage 1.187.O._10N.286.49.F1]|nr:hypothetical protein NVP1187O_222 [Vibrio phage 1.187.O._10N.286.49.F1]